MAVKARAALSLNDSAAASLTSCRPWARRQQAQHPRQAQHRQQEQHQRQQHLRQAACQQQQQ
jgi:hypothetical protein